MVASGCMRCYALTMSTSMMITDDPIAAAAAHHLIVLTPHQVEVADGRDEVAGWEVSSVELFHPDDGELAGVRIPEDETGHVETWGTVIPPEGDSVDCWADLTLDILDNDDVMETIHEWTRHTDPSDEIVIVCDARGEVLSADAGS